MNGIHLLALGPGALALSQRPRTEDVPALRAAGVTHVVTLLNEGEGARQLGDAVAREGLEWIWIPLEEGMVPERARADEFVQLLEQLREFVASGHKLFIHCSAGIQRTGMLAYALLRQLGLSAEAAFETLVELNQVTAAGVGPHRLAWGDTLAATSPAHKDATSPPPSSDS